MSPDFASEPPPTSMSSSSSWYEGAWPTGTSTCGFSLAVTARTVPERETVQTHGMPDRPLRTDLAAAGAVPDRDLQQRAEPRVRQRVPAAAGLLRAAVDDARVRRDLALRPSGQRLRLVRRRARVPDRPGRVRRRRPSTPRPRPLSRSG